MKIDKLDSYQFFKKNYLDTAQGAFTRASFKGHMKDLLELILIAKHDREYTAKFIKYFLYRLICYDKNLSATFLLKFARQLSDIDYTENEYRQFCEDLTTEIGRYSYLDNLDSEFDFLILSRKDGRVISDDAYINKNKFYDFIIDVFRLQILDTDIAFWNGISYELGTENLTQRLAKTAKVFSFKNFNTRNYIRDYCIDGLNDGGNISHYEIPFLDKILIINKDDPRLETIQIKSNVTRVSYPTINPFQIHLGDITDPKQLQELLFDPTADQMFKDWSNNDPNIYALLQEMVGAVAIHASGKLFKTGFFLYSPKSDTGKTTFCNYLRALCGKDHTSSVTLGDLNSSNVRFRLIKMVGKRINFCDELPQGQTLSSDVIALLKRIMCCEPALTEDKGIQCKESPMNAVQIFACNDIPYYNDSALEKRFQLIPFEHEFIKSTVREDAKDSKKNQAVLRHFVLMMLIGACRLLDRRNKKQPLFTTSQKIEEYRTTVKKNNNPMYQYISEYKDLLTSYEREFVQRGKKHFDERFTFDYQFAHFKEWCNKNGYYQKNKPTATTFRNQVERFLTVRYDTGDFRYTDNKEYASTHGGLRQKVFIGCKLQ